MGLKELQAWNLVRLQHQIGDRRDYFTTPEDLWEIVRTLIDERKKREIDPTLSKLRTLLLAAEDSSVENDPTLQRVRELKDLFELLTGWYEDINQIPTDRLVPLRAWRGGAACADAARARNGKPARPFRRIQQRRSRRGSHRRRLIR